MTDWTELLRGRRVLLAATVAFEVRVSEVTPGDDMDATTLRDETWVRTVVFAEGTGGHACMVGTAFGAEEAGTSDDLHALLVAFGRFREGGHYDGVTPRDPSGINGFAVHLAEASTPTRGIKRRGRETVLELDVGGSRLEVTVDGDRVEARGLTGGAWETLCASDDPAAVLLALAPVLEATNERDRIKAVMGLRDRVAAFEDAPAAATRGPR